VSSLAMYVYQPKHLILLNFHFFLSLHLVGVRMEKSAVEEGEEQKKKRCV